MEYLFVPSLNIFVVQIATWLALLLGAAAVAAALWLLVRLFGTETDEPGRDRPPIALSLTAVLLLGLALRVLWLDIILQGFWTDGVHALKAAAEDRRFFGPHEGRRLLPLEVGNSRVSLFGLYLDFLRLLLVITRNRLTAYTLMNLLPAALIPAAVFLLARRVTAGSAPLFAGIAAAAGLWPLVIARWGWDQQLMSLLLLLALERLAVGMTEGRRGPLLEGGLLAGLACHTFVGGMIGAGGLVVWAAAEGRLARSPGRALWPAVGVLVAVVPLAIFYVLHPELLGGRVVETALGGSPGAVARDATLNVLDYAGEFFFTPDPNARHGLREAYFTPALVACLVLGLVPLLRGVRTDAARRGVAALFVATLAGGILSSANASPSGYRTGLAGALAFIPIGAGLALVAGSKVWSRHGRVALLVLLPLLIVVTEVSRFLRWGLPENGASAFCPKANAAGRFLGQAGVDRVLVDPAVFQEDASSPFVASFQVHPTDSLRPLAPIRIGTLASLQGSAGIDWFVTVSPPPVLQRALRLGLPGCPDRDVIALRVR